MSQELKLRIVSAIVLAVVVLGATWMGGAAFRIVCAVIGLLIYSEWSTITGLATRVVGGNLAKIMCWYDNEWGFTHQMIRLALETVGSKESV